MRTPLVLHYSHVHPESTASKTTTSKGKAYGGGLARDVAVLDLLVADHDLERGAERPRLELGAALDVERPVHEDQREGALHDRGPVGRLPQDVRPRHGLEERRGRVHLRGHADRVDVAQAHHRRLGLAPLPADARLGAVQAQHAVALPEVAAVLHERDALPEAPLDAHQVDFYLRRRLRPCFRRRGRRSPRGRRRRRRGRRRRRRLGFRRRRRRGRLRDRSRGGFARGGRLRRFCRRRRGRLGRRPRLLGRRAGRRRRARRGRFVGVVDDLRRRVDALDRGPAARRGFAQHERAVLLAVGVVVERGGGRPRRRLVRRPERVGAPVRRHDGDARLAHREGPVGAVVEQARAAVRPADVVRADVEPAVHGVADGAEAQAPAGTSRTLGRLRAALGGAHVRRCWGQPGCRMRFS